MLLTMIQFLWIFGQAIQIHIETGISPLFNDVKQSIFLWVIIVTFVFDIFFAGICYEAYKAFKYLDYSEANGTGPLIENKSKEKIGET